MPGSASYNPSSHPEPDRLAGVENHLHKQDGRLDSMDAKLNEVISKLTESGNNQRIMATSLDNLTKSNEEIRGNLYGDNGLVSKAVAAAEVVKKRKELIGGLIKQGVNAAVYITVGYFITRGFTAVEDLKSRVNTIENKTPIKHVSKPELPDDQGMAEETH